MDIERALLEGEWQAQNEKLMQEEERLSILRVRVEGLDEEMEQCRSRQLQRQDEAKWRLELREKDILRLGSNFMFFCIQYLYFFGCQTLCMCNIKETNKIYSFNTENIGL